MPQLDLLQRMLGKQKELMGVLGANPAPSDILTDPDFKDIAIMMMSEVVEVLDPLTVSTKPWKKLDNKDEVRRHVEEELIDVLFFWLEAALKAGWTSEDIFLKYETKHQKNMLRAAGRLTGNIHTAVSKSSEPAMSFDIVIRYKKEDRTFCTSFDELKKAIDYCEDYQSAFSNEILFWSRPNEYTYTAESDFLEFSICVVPEEK